MFDHVTIRVADRAASERFYDTVLEELGVEATYRVGSFTEWQDFSLAQADGNNPPTQRVHIGFVAPSREQVDGFHRAGLAGGWRSDGEPGPRPQYGEGYYGAFLLDPDGNSAEAVHDGDLRRGGVIDHVWIRVRDLQAARAFYATIAPPAGLRAARDTPERVSFRGETGSFSLLPGEPTAHLHMAFPAGDDERVRSFHRAATEQGYESLGEPGERPQYHAGYYAAYVRDPDGNNIELVNHHR